MTKPLMKIAVTPGDEAGVGPELLVDAISRYHHIDSPRFFWCGDRSSLKLGAKRANKALAWLGEDEATLDGGPTLIFFPDLASLSLAERQARFLEISIELAKKDLVDGIVTGPINKTALQFLAGGPFAGQTEFFAKHLGVVKQPFMAFMGGPFMLSLLTTHMPLSKVSGAITEKLLVEHLISVAEHFARIHRKKNTEITIAVLGLNPHAGEGGLIGLEEEQIFKPALSQARNAGLRVFGPLPADGFFAYFHHLSAEERPDVVVAAYHDQGLGPYKLLAEGSAVNVTFGLKVWRTSPAHGTATGLAGLGLACPKSSQMAIKTVIELASI